MVACALAPIYGEALTADDHVALAHVRAHLLGVPCYQLSPASLRLRVPGLTHMPWPDECFTGIPAYNRMMLSAGLYSALSGYEYLLVCQLDALVLSGEIALWCAAGYDYVGAPWLRDPKHPEQGFSRAGNGGFCLRRVSAFLSVLGQRGRSWAAMGRAVCAPLPDLVAVAPRQRWRKRMRIARAVSVGVEQYLARYGVHEDQFWSDRAHLFDPAFRVAPPDVAVGFAFEVAPRYCYEANRRRLPFGCHAWAKYDRAFWEPYLITA